MVIAKVDVDEPDDYYGDEEDGVYVSIAEGPDGWYVSALVDCSSTGFTESLVTDDGPYTNEEDARAAGKATALDWCAENGVTDVGDSVA